MRRSAALTLRERMSTAAPVIAPGVTEAIGARVAARLGFGGLYVSGAGTAAARGLPDMGLLTLTELVDATAVVVEASGGLPVVVDVDTGFGGPLGIRRMARALADVGAAGVQIEDQAAERRCGYLTQDPPVSIDEMLDRLEALRAADEDLVVVARTDALLTEGLDSAVARARAYGREGVDLVMVNGVRTVDDLQRVHDEVGFPMLHNVSGSDRTPALDQDTARRLDVRLVIYPIQAARAAAQAVTEYLGSLLGTAERPPLMPFAQYMDEAGWSESTAFDDQVRTSRRKSDR